MKAAMKRLCLPLVPYFIGLALIQSIFYMQLHAAPFLFAFVFLGYSWILGAIAIFHSRKEKFKLLMFHPLNRYYGLALFVTIIVALLARLATIPVGGMSLLDPGFATRSLVGKVELTAFFVFLYYLCGTVLMFICFLGGELFWRGFAWQKLKSYGIYGVWAIACLWNIWMLPFLVLSGPMILSDIFSRSLSVISLNFVLTPILLYYRTQGKSVFVSSLFYSSLQAISTFLTVVFPIFSPTISLVYGGGLMTLLIAYSARLRLYSRDSW